MTRQECEQQILEKLREIANIAKEYNPDTKWLSASFFLSDNFAFFHNSYLEHQSPDVNKPIKLTTFNFIPEKVRTLNETKEE